MPRAAITPTARSTSLVLGETLLLGLTCGMVVNFPGMARWIWSGTSLGTYFADHGVQMVIRGLLIAVTCQLTFFFQDLYDWRITSNRNTTAVRLLQSIFTAAILVGLVHYALGLVGLGEYTSNVWSTIIALVSAFPAAYLYRIVFHSLFARWRLNDRVLLLGSGNIAKTIEDEIQNRQDPGYEIVGYVGRRPPTVPLTANYLGATEEIRRIAVESRANRVVVALGERRRKLPLIELLNCRLAGIRVEEAELLYEKLTGKIPVQRLRPSYLIFSEGFQRSKTHFAIKRAMDVVLSVFGLVVTLPLCALVAVIIKLESKGPVLFSQERVGREGRNFTIYKFRSMRTDAEDGGPQWAAADDDRVTRVGRFIRLTRIDEIPQMWNVLRNEMSFVGPRPERPYFVDELRKQIPYYMERLLVKPGITGWAQINYKYGSTVEDSLTKLQYDLYYIKHLSIFLDFLILIGTVKVILLRRGAV